jgi:hypothetical protein
MPALLTSLKQMVRSQWMKLVPDKRAVWSASPAIHVERHKLIYIPIPKVACTSLTALCVDLLGFSLPKGSWKAGVFRGDALDDSIDTELRDSARISTAQASDITDHWCFAATRNPYDRLVSCYSEKVCNQTEHKDFHGGLSKNFIIYGKFYAHMPFSKFVDAVCSIPEREAEPHFRSQHCFVTDAQGKLIPDFLCDLGEFALLTDQIQQRTGVDVSIPHLLKSKRSSWRSHYTETLKRKVAARYQRDFDLFGYDWNA